MTDKGYARVSTRDQDLALQLDALRKAGCAGKDIYTDKASGKLTARAGLEACLASLEPGDVLTVWKLDRLGRSLIHLVTTVAELGGRGVGFRSLTEGFDTTTNGGKLVFHIFAALAEFERTLIQERTRAGLEAAAERGRKGGRPAALSREQAEQAARMLADGKPVAEIARVLKTSRPSVYRALERKTAEE